MLSRSAACSDAPSESSSSGGISLGVTRASSARVTTGLAGGLGHPRVTTASTESADRPMILTMSIDVRTVLEDLDLQSENSGAFAGRWIDTTGPRLESVNPSTGQVIASVRQAS